MDKIGNLKSLLHGRLRKRMRLAMSEWVRSLETLLIARKLGRLTQQLLPDHSDPLDFNQLRDNHGNLFDSEAAIDKKLPRAPCATGWEFHLD